MRAGMGAEPDDVLWRRSKLGLRVNAEDRAALDAFMRTGRAAAAFRGVRPRCRSRSNT